MSQPSPPHLSRQVRVGRVLRSLRRQGLHDAEKAEHLVIVVRCQAELEEEGKQGGLLQLDRSVARALRLHPQCASSEPEYNFLIYINQAISIFKRLCIPDCTVQTHIGRVHGLVSAVDLPAQQLICQNQKILPSSLH